MNNEQIKKRNIRQYNWQKENTDRINFTMPKGTKEEIKAYARSKGISASEWINEAIREKMERQDNSFVEPVIRDKIIE